MSKVYKRLIYKFSLHYHQHKIKNGDFVMMRSISLGKYISVQGMFVRDANSGKIVVRVGDKTFEGTPIS